MRSLANLLISGAIACSLAAAPVIAAETLTVGGTGAVTEALIQIGPAFTAATGVDLVVVPGLGTSGANAAVADGVLGLAVDGRDLRDTETALGLKVVATLRTPFSLVTSRPGPDGVASGEVAGLFAADAAQWPDGTPLRIILRPIEESDNQILGALFPGMTEAIDRARLRRDLTVAASDQDNIAAAEATEGSLVGATLAQIVAERPDLRFVAIDGVMPSIAAYEDRSYPYSKTLYVVVGAQASIEAIAFLDYIATPQGTALLREVGILVDDE